MTQEEINLLLTDICSRLPYGVKIRIEYPFLEEKDWHPETLYGLDLKRLCIASTSIRIEEFKPYLFPLSSMTEEQKKEFDQVIELELKSINDEIDPTQVTEFEVDFYHKHHLDWRGLIPMGLAIDATGLSVY